MIQDTLNGLSKVKGVICSFVLSDEENLLGMCGDKQCDDARIFSVFGSLSRSLAQLHFSLNIMQCEFDSFHMILKKFEGGVLAVVVEKNTDTKLLNITLKMALKQISNKYRKREYKIISTDNACENKSDIDSPKYSETQHIILRLENHYRKILGPIAGKLLEKFFQELQSSREDFPQDKIDALVELMAEKIEDDKLQREFRQQAYALPKSGVN